MPEIDVTGPRSARGVWAMYDYVDRIWHEDGRREAFVGYGHYRENYVLENAEWRIARMELSRIRVDRIDPATLQTFPHRGAPPDFTLPPEALSRG